MDPAVAHAICAARRPGGRVLRATQRCGAPLAGDARLVEARARGRARRVAAFIEEVMP